MTERSRFVYESFGSCSRFHFRPWWGCHCRSKQNPNKMNRYGVKLTNGKVIWIQADDAQVADGMLVFVRKSGAPTLIAGFNLKEVHHFALPEVMVTAQTEGQP